MPRSVTLKGNALALDGAELRIGQPAPDVKLRRDLVSDARLLGGDAHVRILNVVPSLDTPVCAMQTRRFYQELDKLPGVWMYTISCDLPAAQKRFCGAESMQNDRFVVLSDHKDLEFGKAYGTLIPDLRILCRALFVLDSKNVIRHVEYVPEIADHPNYEAALARARESEPRA